MSINRFALIVFSALVLFAVSCDGTSSKTTIIPIKTSIAKATEGINYNYTFQVSDPSTEVRWKLESNPSWLTINSTSGVLTGTPPVGFTKSETIEFIQTLSIRPNSVGQPLWCEFSQAEHR